MCVTVGIGDGVYQNNSMSSFVKGFGDVSESLLSRRVPYIQRYRLVVMLDALDLKVDSNRAQVICLKTVLAVSH